MGYVSYFAFVGIIIKKMYKGFMMPNPDTVSV